MPDHVHLLILISGDENGRPMVAPDENGRPMVAPTVSRIVQQLKGYVTKQIGESIWQKLFYDHVIRNDRDYEEHRAYIFENPMRQECKKEW